MATQNRVTELLDELCVELGVDKFSTQMQRLSGALLNARNDMKQKYNMTDAEADGFMQTLPNEIQASQEALLRATAASIKDIYSNPDKLREMLDKSVKAAREQQQK